MGRRGEISALENKLLQYFHAESCNFFARGATALYSLFYALKKTTGKHEVIIPSLCCESVAMAALYAGMTPVFADVDRSTLCMTLETASACVTPDTSAVLLVYLFGNAIDYSRFEELRRRGIVIIEDLAQAVGGSVNGRNLGSNFDFTLLSFSKGKIVEGEGGAILQVNPAYGNVPNSFPEGLPEVIDSASLHYKERSLRDLTHSLIQLARADSGVQFRGLYEGLLPNYQDLIVQDGSIGDPRWIQEQFENLEQERSLRAEKYEFYRTQLTNDLFQCIELGPLSIPWRVPILAREPSDMYRLTSLLRQNNILVSNHYFSLDRILYDKSGAHSSYIDKRVLNLWVDDLASFSSMEKAVDLVNSYRGGD